MGRYGARKRPKIPINTRMVTSTTPTRTNRRATNRCHAPERNVRGRTAGTGWRSAMRGIALSTAHPDAWVEDTIQHIDGDVGQDDRGSGDEYERLQHQVL